MQDPRHNRMYTAYDTRYERIAVMHREHARALERRVALRARAEQRTIEDACSFAWTALLTHPQVDVPSRHALAWLALTATHKAWQLERERRRDGLVDDQALRRLEHVPGVRGPDELAAQRDRLGLVAELPERPRRFLLRLAEGHSYREIAAVEAVSVRTAARQIARARRLVRALDAEQAA